MPTPLKLTACVCTCDRYELVEGALRSLLDQEEFGTRLSVLVVDNTPAPRRRVGWLRSGVFGAAPAAEFVTMASTGLSAARNRGIALCRTDIIAFVDDDARVGASWARDMLHAFERVSDAGAIGGPVLPIWETSPPAWLPESMYGYLSILDRGVVERDIQVGEWLCGANLALRMSTTRAAGRFREDLGRRSGTLISNEELDYCRRLQQNGKRVLYSPKPVVHHLVPEHRCTQDWVRRRVAWQEVSDLLLEFEKDTRAGRIVNEAASILSIRATKRRQSTPLFSQVDGPEAFQRQCEEIRTRIRTSLISGENLDAALTRRISSD